MTEGEGPSEIQGLRAGQGIPGGGASHWGRSFEGQGLQAGGRQEGRRCTRCSKKGAGTPWEQQVQPWWLGTDGRERRRWWGTSGGTGSGPGGEGESSEGGIRQDLEGTLGVEWTSLDVVWREESTNSTSRDSGLSIGRNVVA